MVLRVCRAVVGVHDAQDAWQETFLAALRAYPTLPADTNVEAWLVTIAHRKAIDVTRRASRAGVSLERLPDRRAAEGADEVDLDLTRALATLSERQRLSIVYHYLGGLPYAEVAQLLDSTTSAARRAAADGIARLRTMKGALR
jgi:RNA polymerase sigma factor (sigma-70 family)